MLTLYHGTSDESLNNIIDHGFNTRQLIWDGTSDEDFIYFHKYDEDGEYNAKFYACQSAQIAAASQLSKSNRIGLIKIEVPEQYKKIVEDDETLGADKENHKCIEIDTLNQYIKEKKIKKSIEFVHNIYDPHIAYMYCLNMPKLYEYHEKPEIVSLLESDLNEDLYNHLILDSIEEQLENIKI